MINKQARNNKILARFEEGIKDVKVLGEEFSLSKFMIYKILKKLGAKFSRHHPKGHKIFPKDKPRIIERYKAGVKLEVIAAFYGCGVATLYSVLDETKVPRREPAKGCGVAPADKTSWLTVKKIAIHVPTAAHDSPFTVRPPLVMTSLELAKTGSGRARATPLRLKFPPLPGEPGYVYENA